MRIAIFCEQKDRLFCINLSAIWLTEYCKKELMQILPYVDILFGNESVSLQQIYSEDILKKIY